MGDKVTLKVDERDVHGKKVKQLRRKGLTPGVVYGPGIEPMSVQMPTDELRRVIQQAGKHTPVHLTGDKRRIAMIKDVDFDPVKNSIRHISFHAVKADEPVTTEVVIRLVGEGESEAEKAGLIILQTLDRIEIKALPMDLPDSLELSTTHLKEEGERVTVADIELPENVEFVEKVDQRTENDEDEEQVSILDQLVASVWEPSALQAANESAGGDAETADADEVESENGGEDSESSEAGGEEANSEETKE
ncbi:50S ribosomal protein L25 [Candidatus Saccharibacteria bacterium]|nr:MAG: 50S ribosomal protein L25 [Candidatus Saccharibacteria bacterium]